jgi:Restriction Enzyme Adenine Methylase Associated
MTNSVQPVTFYVPNSAAEPTEVNVQHSGLRMVLVSRESIHLLDESWRVLGIYFLIGPADDPDCYRAYVGEVGRATLVQRARHHAKEKPWWSRALLITRDSRDGFNSAEIGWLEGRLFDVLNNAVACEVMNGNRPGDESLPERERAVLERYVEPIMAALRACGASPDTADQKPAPKGRKKVTRYSESVADLLDAELLKAGTMLRPMKKGRQQARVLEDGRLETGGQVFDSLSAAAKAVTGSIAEAGWDFWGAPSGDGSYVALAKLRERLRENGRPVERMEPAAQPDKQAAAQGKPALPGLAGLVQRKGLPLPLDLHTTYRGERAEARIEMDGSVTYRGRSFRSPSLAASAARKALGYTGVGKAETNGWMFWRYTDRDGVSKKLDTLRSERVG